MRILFLSDYQALFQALELEAVRYSSLEILNADSQTQPLVLPDFDFLFILPLGQQAEAGLASNAIQLSFWQERLPQLVELCESRNSRLVLISSDLVFAPDQEAVSELDSPLGSSLAAKQLIALEQLVATNEQNIILRIPPLLSSDPEGGLAQLVERCQQHKTPENIDYRGLQPVNDLARVLLGICLQIDAGAQGSGVYHYAGSEPVSQTELMHTLARTLELPPYPADPSGTNRQGMNGQHLLESFGVHPRAWRSSLPNLLEALNVLPSKA